MWKRRTSGPSEKTRKGVQVGNFLSHDEKRGKGCCVTKRKQAKEGIKSYLFLILYWKD